MTRLDDSHVSRAVIEQVAAQLPRVYMRVPFRGDVSQRTAEAEGIVRSRRFSAAARARKTPHTGGVAIPIHVDEQRTRDQREYSAANR